MKMLIVIVLAAVSLAVFSPAVHATPITSATDPLLDGATIITFSELDLGTTDPTIDGVSFEGEGGVTTIDLDGSRDLNNGSYNVAIGFSSPVTAFGMDILLADHDVTVEAYNAGMVLLGEATLLSPGSDIVNGFLGVGDVGLIKFARVVVNNEYIRIDNFRFVNSAAVPEPATMLLLGFGLLGLWGLRRKFKK